jgi:hypothetical protein
MASLANGQCAHHAAHGNRCLELATETRPITLYKGTHLEVTYEVPLCQYHREIFDTNLRRMRKELL